MQAVYPGSFDPITFGHMDVIQRAINIFDKITILIPNESIKAPLLTASARKELIERLYQEQPNVEVVLFDGLLVDWLRANNAKIIIRGIRDSVDMAAEWRMAHCNKVIDPAIETLFLASSPTVSHISSSLVREIIAYQGDLSEFVPEVVVKALAQ